MVCPGYELVAVRLGLGPLCLVQIEHPDVVHDAGFVGPSYDD